MWPDWAIYCPLGNFSKPVAIFWPNHLQFRQFFKGVKIFMFSNEIIFGHFLDIWRFFHGHAVGLSYPNPFWRYWNLSRYDFDDLCSLWAFIACSHNSIERCYLLTEIVLITSLKAQSHSPQWSVDSTVDCVNAETGIFLSLCVNATICCKLQLQMQLLLNEL